MQAPARALATAAALLALAVPAVATAGTFEGTDGATYESAPLTVPGQRGEKYYGPDFDVACGIGSGISVSMDRVAKLARVIERSGRTVVWTFAPSKTAVLPKRLPTRLPHGRCDRRGLEAVQRVMDRTTERNFLPLRRRLTEERHQAYFKTDMHWTTVGGAVYARALAERLDPDVAALQRYRYGTETRYGLLNWFSGDPAEEVAETARPTTPVKTRTARDSSSQWTGYPELSYDYSWSSRPAKRTIPGRTLLVGDSFTMYALDSLLPLFRQGRWLWYSEVPESTLVHAIRAADTVVLEGAQVHTPLGSTLTDSGFRRRVQRALR